MWWVAFMVAAMVMQVVFAWLNFRGYYISDDWVGVYMIVMIISLVGMITAYVTAPVPVWAICLLTTYILLLGYTPW